MRGHRCNFKPCLIYIGEEKLYDLASYCCECGKIGAAGNNEDRVTNHEIDGRDRWRLKTSSELLSSCGSIYPIFNIEGTENGN